MQPLWPPRHNSFSYISGPPRIPPGPRSLVILGSTGSIGRNALSIAARTDQLRILALSCGQNISLLASQALKFRPPFLGVASEELAEKLRSMLPQEYRPEIYFGVAGYMALAQLAEADCILSCQAGSAGLAGTLAAAEAGKTIALANKESLVMAGTLLRRICAATQAAILPVDSEHFALFQCLAGRADAKSLILTASGGPFRGRTAAEIHEATPEMALKHPNWSMGSKITIDSATLMNKGLEFLEAMHLFGADPEKIKIVIHPQSIVHSLVEFRNNSLLAQLAVPDMRLPIAACLLWPREDGAFVPELDLLKMPPLTFEEPDYATFPSPLLAKEAALWEPPEDWQELGLNPACIVMNCANEAAVEAFLAKKCTFGQIAELVRGALQEFVYGSAPPPVPMRTRGIYEVIVAVGEMAKNWTRGRLERM